MKFIDYLEGEHFKQYFGSSDSMRHKFDLWLENLDNEELINHGENYGKYLSKNS